MNRTKKIISIILVSILLVFASITLMACNESKTATETYTMLNNSLSTYKESRMFGVGSNYGVQTNYDLQKYSSKNSSGTLIYDYSEHKALLSLGLNFIEDNYERLNGLEVKHNYSDINDSIKEMDSAYNQALIEYTELADFESTIDYQIYNSNFDRYKEAVRVYTIKVYAVAENLGNFLLNKAKVSETLGTDEMTTDALDFYISYNQFLIARDYMKFFLESGAGANYDETLFNTVLTDFKGYSQSVFAQSNPILDAEQANGMKELFDAVDGDRANVTKALNEFSIYFFYAEMEGVIPAYENYVQDAQIYYNTIESYFGSNGILENLYLYLCNL